MIPLCPYILPILHTWMSVVERQAWKVIAVQENFLTLLYSADMLREIKHLFAKINIFLHFYLFPWIILRTACHYLHRHNLCILLLLCWFQMCSGLVFHHAYSLTRVRWKYMTVSIGGNKWCVDFRRPIGCMPVWICFIPIFWAVLISTKEGD